MDALWAIVVILIVLFVLFVILPSILPARRVGTNTVIGAVGTPQPHGPSPLEMHRMEAAKSKAMLDSHYQSAKATVPEDHPPKPIGACPYSKSPSTDLPLADVPMCVAVQPENMHLRAPPLAISI